MNVLFSYKWLASHFEKEIPTAEEISKLFMKHLCEVEGMEKKGDDTIFDLKIMPDRGHDLLSHKGIAQEISVLTGVPMSRKPKVESKKSDSTTTLRVVVEDPKLCPRYMGRVIENIKVGESPVWLRERLESVGQRSINNIVDITNFVMLEVGQPMHAFDLNKLSGAEIFVRNAIDGEKLLTLDGKELVLAPDTLVIADSKQVLALAGIKGGKDAGVDETTTSIVFESANFNAVNTRKTAQRVGIRTDSSKRFEHDISPILAEEAMDMAVTLLLEVCPEAKIGEIVDVVAQPAKNYKVGISLSELNGILGTKISQDDVLNILARLGFSYQVVPDPRAQVIVQAPTFVGKPYKFGASILYGAPYAFDCAGLIAYLWKEAGVAIPRMSIDQFVFGEEVSLDSLIPGDLIFSNSETDNVYYESIEWMRGTKVPSGIDHVGMYLGDGKIIHASRYNKEGVAIENLKDSPRFVNIVGARRIVVPNEPRFVVTIPLPRLDLRIKEDLAEEIGRIYGFDNIPDTPLPLIAFKATPLKVYYYANLIRDTLVEYGFSEVFTSSFRNEGVFAVANPIAEDKGFLRKELSTGILQSLELNGRNAPLLSVDEIKIFEIGKVFPGVGFDKEKLSCALGVYITRNIKNKDEVTRRILEEIRDILNETLGVTVGGATASNIFEFDLGALLEKLPSPKVPAPFKAITTRYKKTSAYPFMLRDIALWVPEGVTSDAVRILIVSEGGVLLHVARLFDTFAKEVDGARKTSYAFNLVFQSHEKTLSDDEVNVIMERVQSALVNEGYQVR